MHARTSSSAFLIYVGVIATALAVIAFGLVTVLKASAGWSQAGASDRTLLQSQIDSSREIRRALATPVSIPPLPPITARPVREAAAVQAKKRPSLTAAAMNAMAMGQNPSPRSATPEPARPEPSYSPRDRMAGGGW